MIRKSRARNSSLFLMELILAILFFSITSAVCVQLFVKSHLLSQDSWMLTHAVSECSSVAEICSTADDASSAITLISDIYPNAEIESANEYAAVYYDSDFNICDKKNSSYMLTVQLSQKERLLSADINIKEAGKDSAKDTIYSLHTKHHIARRISNE